MKVPLMTRPLSRPASNPDFYCTLPARWQKVLKHHLTDQLVVSDGRLQTADQTQCTCAAQVYLQRREKKNVFIAKSFQDVQT